ncbi:MAG TPA: class I SAM-dependent methyltransferase [Blastocatellia bacterium]|nr:class I SAM-dependent methyltransferase [Blastocatellia bacterium]
MNNYDIATYGDRIADIYDQLHTSYEEAAISALSQLAGTGPVLELGIGTGRIALPLANRGLEVHGIDASSAMISKLRAKPGGDSISVTLGDFADVKADGEFSLIFVVFNTFFVLLSQKEQVRCFRNVAKHLSKDGVFLLETFVPDMTRFERGQNVSATKVTSEDVRLDVSEHDPLEQRVNSHHLFITGDGIKLYPVQIRYAYPSELDLMAELAGLKLKWRWGGWQGESFTAKSEKHISVYGRAST